MPRFLSATRYVILVPIFGLATAAAFLFVLGGAGLIRLLVDVLLSVLRLREAGAELTQEFIIFEVVEYVHTFLVGTVLYITAVGLYQLFIHEISFASWLKIEDTEQLETNLIGVTVVVLAVNFMGAVFAGKAENLLEYGAAIALPIAALGVFVGLRAWADKVGKKGSSE